jgi:peptidoglycan biosynthesis protein MviN/MurJ (putative lipid II flippase)
VMLVGALASVPLDLVFVPWMEHVYHNGAIGGGLSFLVTEAFMVAIGLWKITPHVLRPQSLLRVAKIVGAGAAMIVAAWPLRHRFVALPIVVGALVYGAGVLTLRVLTDDEVGALRTLVARVRSLLHRSPAG